MADAWALKNKSRNDLYMRKLYSAIDGFSRATLISATAAAYKAAVRKTWQDSGRAAYNWRIAAGGKDYSLVVDEKRDSPPVGKSREHRSETGGEDAVVKECFAKYGIREGQEFPAYSGYVKERVGDPSESRMFGLFSGFKGSNVREVAVYNPIGRQMGEYSDRAFNHPGRNVREHIGAAIHEQIRYLQVQLDKGSRTPEQIKAFLESKY